MNLAHNYKLFLLLRWYFFTEVGVVGATVGVVEAGMAAAVRKRQIGWLWLV